MLMLKKKQPEFDIQNALIIFTGTIYYTVDIV